MKKNWTLLWKPSESWKWVLIVSFLYKVCQSPIMYPQRWTQVFWWPILAPLEEKKNAYQVTIPIRLMVVWTKWICKACWTSTQRIYEIY